MATATAFTPVRHADAAGLRRHPAHGCQMRVKFSPLLIAAWLALVLAGVLLLRATPITHDLTQFMPSGATREAQLAVGLLREGPASRLVLMALEGHADPDLADFSNRFAGRLRTSGLFSQVRNGNTGDPAGLALAFRYRYLLDPATHPAAFSEAQLHQALGQRLAELSGALPLLDRRTLAADPTAAIRSVLQNWAPPQQPARQFGVWFTGDGRSALLLAVTRASGFDPQAQQHAITTIHAAFAAAEPPAGVQLVLSGAPVFTKHARDTIRHDIRTLSIAASLLVGGFLLLVYRSLYLVLLCGLPLLSGFLAGCAAVALLFGGIHGITLVFGLTLLGVAIDYPIHLFSHLEPGGSATLSMRRIWPTLRLGVVTTCIGYLALVFSDFSGLAQLGIFTSCGLLAAAAVTRWLLPAVIARGKPMAAAGAMPARLHTLLRFPRWLSAGLMASAVLALVALPLLSPPVWETDLAALGPLPAAQRELDTRLRAELGAPDVNQLLVVEGADVQAVLQAGERVAAHLDAAVELGLLSGYDLASRYLPSVTTQKRRQDALPEAAEAAKRLRGAMQDLPFREQAFEPFLAALEESRRLPMLTLQDVEASLLGTRIQPLLFGSGEGWKALILLSGVISPSEFQDWWRQQRLPAARFLDLKAVSAGLLEQFRNTALGRMLAGLLAIALILSVGLKSSRRGLRTLLPVLVAVGLTAVLLGSLGERLSLFHLVALLLTAGIGIDYSLFFRRRESLTHDRQATLHALLVCAASTVTVFGILATSPISVLRAIGLTVAVGVPLCFLLSLAAARLEANGSPPD